MVNYCGLVTAKKEAVPLKSIDVEVKVRDHVASVSAALQYKNEEERPLEAIFVFPLPGDAAVCHFSAKIGLSEVVAEVREKQQAREEYDDALSSGQQAFLLEESEESPDVFTLSVGSLPPGESASIRLEYITELAVQADDGLRFCLPAVLNPRYQPQGTGNVGGGGGSIQVTSMPASLVPYGLSITAHVSSPRPISKVESNCSLSPLQYLNQEQTQATVNLAEGHKFDRDVELLIYYKDAHQPSAVVEAGKASAKPGSLMGDPVIMLSLYPEFPPAVMSTLASKGEFVFLLDQSGSMQSPLDSTNRGQDRIGSARDTLLLLLKSLPMGCFFNIYGFGSRYKHIFPKSVEYTQKNMEKALREVENIKADMGGTEILQPLQHIYSQPCIPSQPRQLFVFTDGEVGNTKQVLDLVKRNAGSHRCFSFGIGQGASSALITGMAREGGGQAQFITGSERMQPKVMQSLQFALQPAVVDISVDWDVPQEMSVTPLSPPITTLFQGQRSLLYAQLSGESSGVTEGCVTVRYSLAGQPLQSQLRFALTPSEDTGMTIHRLGSLRLIRSLEGEERLGKNQGLKEKVVDLSVQSGVSSAFTAFIAVNKSNGEAVQGPLLRRNIPTPMLFAQALCSAPPQYQAYAGPMRSSLCSRLPLMPASAGGMRKSLPKFKAKSFGGSSNSGYVPYCLPMDCDDLDDQGMRCPESSVQSLIRAGSSSSPPPRDLLLQLISLQRASGSWLLDPALASVFGKTSQEVSKPKPSQVNEEEWATILALIWLHGSKMDSQVEWQLLALKAVSWLHTQKVQCVAECVAAGNTLLGCKVEEGALGL